MNLQNARILVAYFSRQGKNIVSGGTIEDLPMATRKWWHG